MVILNSLKELEKASAQNSLDKLMWNNNIK
jgi:hypothetical protein